MTTENSFRLRPPGRFPAVLHAMGDQPGQITARVCSVGIVHTSNCRSRLLMAHPGVGADISG